MPQIDRAIYTKDLTECQQQVASLKTMLSHIRGVLAQVQWGNTIPVTVMGEGTKYIGMCPLCDQSDQRGHAPDCPVGLELGR